MQIFNKEVIGVIGGCGVAAAIEFLHRIERKLVTEYGCTDDCEQPEVILYQATQAPNRIAYASGKSEVSFAPYFIKAARNLKYAGATFGCIPCNTAHCEIDRIERESGLQFINLIDVTVKHVTDSYPGVKSVGIICSTGTVNSKIYEYSAGKFGFDTNFIYPSEALQGAVSDGICAVKSGLQYRDEGAAAKYFIAAMDHLVASGAQLIILGCTEVPLAIRTATHKGVPVIDTISLLASACIEKCKRSQ